MRKFRLSLLNLRLLLLKSNPLVLTQNPQVPKSRLQARRNPRQVAKRNLLRPKCKFLVLRNIPLAQKRLLLAPKNLCRAALLNRLRQNRESSSSEDVESSSSEGLVGVSSKILAQGIRVNAKNGAIYVYAPQQGRKVVRIFSPIGSLLLERAMDGSELVVDDKILGKMGLILSVSQGNRALFTGMINAR